MGASSELFLKMSSEYYFSIPDDIRKEYLTDKVYSESLNDYSTLIQDKEYRKLVSDKKKINKALDDRKDVLRELNKQQLNK